MATKKGGTHILNDKQQAFVTEYLKDLNASAAYIRAGYKTKASRVCASQLLSNPNIIDAINNAMAERSKRTNITVDSVLQDLAEIKERCLQRFPVMEYDPATGSMVQAKDEEGRHVWQFEPNPAIKSLELLGKHLKMWTDRVEIDVSDSLADAIQKGRERLLRGEK